MKLVPLLSLLLSLTPQVAHAAPSCDATNMRCSEPGSYPVLTFSFSVVSGRAYIVETGDLKNQAGANPPDTVLWILRNSSNVVVGVNDDIVPATNKASRVSFTPAFSGTVQALVSDFANERYGTTDLTVRENGVTIGSLNDQRFGGFSLFNQTVRTGDRLFVGLTQNGNFLGPSPTTSVTVFSLSGLSCTSNCGTYQRGTADVSTLEQIMTSSISSTTATIVVGSGGAQQGWSDLTYYHSRLGTSWSGTQYADPDCDGLTRELETLIGTCDTTTGPSADCQNTSRRKYSAATGFTPSDTDGDSLRDDTELYGIRMDCSQSPVTPFYSAGTCTDVTYSRPSGRSPFCVPSPAPTGVYLITSPRSALGVNPRDLDMLIEVRSRSASPGEALDANHLTMINYAFELEGLQCTQTTANTSCPGGAADLDDFDYVNVSTSPIADAKYDTKMPYVPLNQWYIRSYLNRRFEPLRRVTGTFFHATMMPFNGGFTEGFPARYMFSSGDDVGGDADEVTAHNFIHEAGHLLGIQGDTSSPQPNYVSQMNYRTAEDFPAKMAPGQPDIWPNDWGTACPCTSGGVCDTATNTCRVSCERDEIRFSRGVNLSLSELVQSEANQRHLMAAQAMCHRGFGSGANPFRAECTGAGNDCRISWDQDLDYLGAQNVDFDESGFATNGVVSDLDDWDTMRNNMKGGILVNEPPFTRLLVYMSDFESSASPLDYTAYDQITFTSGVSLVPGVGTSGSALNFSGPCVGGGCTADNVSVPDSAAIDTIGRTVSGVPPQGFRFDAYVRFTDFTTGAGHQIVDTSLFDIWVENSTRRASFSVYDGSLTTGIVSPSTILVANQWYWIVALWNRANGEQRLYIIPYFGAWSIPAGTCSRRITAPSNEVNMSGLLLGTRPSAPSTYALKGEIDQPHLWNYVHEAGANGQCMWGMVPGGPGTSNDINLISCGAGTSLCGN